MERSGSQIINTFIYSWSQTSNIIVVDSELVIIALRKINLVMSSGFVSMPKQIHDKKVLAGGSK